MGCGASKAVHEQDWSTPKPNLPVAQKQQQSAHQGTQQISAQPAQGGGIDQGATVLLDGKPFVVQYVTFRGLLDLKGSDGEVSYGVDPSLVTVGAAASAAAGTDDASLPAPRPCKPQATTSPDTVESDEQQPLLELIGEPLARPGGSGARVYRCRLDGGETELAVKLLEVSGARPEHLEVMTAEVELCRGLVHERIVRFIHVSCGCPIPRGGPRHVVIVMEMLPLSLDTLISRRRAASPARHFPGWKLLRIVNELADALRYLHALDIVHRDVNPRNTFFEASALDEDGDGDEATWCPRLRLGDFDVSARSAEPLLEFIGTPTTTPPEMWRFEPHHTPADIWALGMTLQWCLLLEDPMGEFSMPEWEARVCAADLPVLATVGQEPAVRTVAQRCLELDPAARATAAELYAETLGI